MKIWNSRQIELLKNTAVVSLVGKGKGFTLSADGVVAFAEGTTPVTEDQITTEMTRIQSEYDAQTYVRNRTTAYPSTGDQLDMMYKDNKNSTTTHADAVEAVKTKWPKDNSGPVE